MDVDLTKDPDKMSIRELRAECKYLRTMNVRKDQLYQRAQTQLNALERAAIALRDDMIMRADIGTYDGDHSVQAGMSVWYSFCKALDPSSVCDHEGAFTPADNDHVKWGDHLYCPKCHCILDKDGAIIMQLTPPPEGHTYA